MDEFERGFLAKHPNLPTHAWEALEHVVAVYEDLPDDSFVIEAAVGMYPDAPRTGLTMGDLRTVFASKEKLQNER